jgi:hypothetical protein
MSQSSAERFIKGTRRILRRFTVLSFVLLAGYCLGQEKGGVDENWAVPNVRKILSGEHRSGSLEFWGGCDIAWPRPDFPRLRPLTGREGSALDALQEMFADDTKMRVTQDAGGKIRMVETDVPQDFLEVKIHHLSFSSLYHSGAIYHNGAWALSAVLHTPEVMDFMAQKIGPTRAWGGWGMPGQIATYGKSVPGDLNDVTVAQALDYVLETFPGFWTYQNCHDPNGSRTIFISFLENLPVNDASLLEGK